MFITIALIISFAAALYARTGQVYFKFEITSRDELDKLTKTISIDNVITHTVYAYANDEQFNYFKTLGYDYIILPKPGSLISPRMSVSKEAILNWDSYPTYEAYVSMMYQFHDSFPSLCVAENIGYSVEGREMWWDFRASRS